MLAVRSGRPAATAAVALALLLGAAQAAAADEPGSAAVEPLAPLAGSGPTAATGILAGSGPVAVNSDGLTASSGTLALPPGPRLPPSVLHPSMAPSPSCSWRDPRCI